MVTFRLMVSIAMVACAAAAASVPNDWKVLKDKPGLCQAAVPADWTVNQLLPHIAVAPNRSDATLSHEPGKTVKPMAGVVQEVMGVGRMIENSERRIFWASNPATLKGGPSVVIFHVTVNGRGGTCSMRIAAQAGLSEELTRKIADTLAPVR